MFGCNFNSKAITRNRLHEIVKKIIDVIEWQLIDIILKRFINIKIVVYVWLPWQLKWSEKEVV